MSVTTTPHTRHQSELTKADVLHECVMGILSKASGIKRNYRIHPSRWPCAFQDKKTNLEGKDEWQVIQALMDDSCFNGNIDVSWLNITGGHGHTALMDIIHLPYDHADGKPLTPEGAAQLSQRFLDALFGTQERPSNAWSIISRCAKEAVAELFGKITTEGFTLLQDAAVSGNLALFDRVVGLYEQHAPKKLAEHIGLPNRDKFTVLQQAAISGNLALLDRVVGLYEQHAPKKLAEHIGLPAKGNFTLLQQAAISDNLALFDRVVGLYEQHAPKKLAEHIGLPNQDNFTLLQDAVKSGNLAFLERVVGLYEQDAPKKLAEHIGLPNRDKFTVLQQAAISGNLALLDRVVGLYEQHAPKKLAEHIGLPNQDNFTLLQQAAISGNLALLDRVVELYNKAPGKLAEHIKSCSKGRFSVLESSAKKGAPLAFVKICALCDRHVPHEKLIEFLDYKDSAVLRHVLKAADEQHNMTMPKVLGDLYRSVYADKAKQVAAADLATVTSAEIVTDGKTVPNRFQYVPPRKAGAAEVFIAAARGEPTTFVDRVAGAAAGPSVRL